MLMTPERFQRLESLFVFAAMLVLFRQSGSSWVLFAVLILAPDLFMLGYVKDSRIGALVYNFGHSYGLPVLALAGWWFGDVGWLLPVGVIWVAHIAMDRLFGYGLKLESGFRDTHLGEIGRR